MSKLLELDVLRELATQLTTAAHRKRGALVKAAAQRLGIAPQTVYARLKQHGLFDSGRKRRADAGTTIVSESLALQAAGVVHLSTRANGKQTKSLKSTPELLAANGIGVVDEDSGEIRCVAPTTLARAMRKYNCHPAQLAAGHPSLVMRSLHPNHVWQVDMSVCVLFYAPDGGIARIDDREVYKNKPDAVAKVSRDLCLRWLVTDHASDAFFVRYMAGHEDAMSFIEFFIEAIQERPGEPFCGLPKILVMDPGAAARAKSARNLLDRLGIEVIVHRPRNPRAKGGVEGGHNRWEMTFESRLSLWLPPDLAALNEKADLVRRAYCSTAQHSRHRMPRYAAWMLIKGDEFRPAPSPELCREGVTNDVKTRDVSNQLTVSYGGRTYSVRHIPGAASGEKLRVRVNLFRDPAIDVLVAGEDGTDTIWTVEPAEQDKFGFYDFANTWGEEIRALPKSAAEQQLARIHLEAFGVPTQAEADAARKARATAYAGVINPFADAEQATVPTFLPRRGEAHVMPLPARELPPVSIVEAVRRLKAAGETRSDLYAALIAEFPDRQVPGAELARREAALRDAAHVHAATGT